MNWLTIFIVFVLNVRSEIEFCTVQKAIFLENNFWHTDEIQPKTDNGYLYDVVIDLECITCGKPFDFLDDSETYYILNSTNLGYYVLRNLMKIGVPSILKLSENDNFFLRFCFLFTDEPINKSHYNINYEGKVQEFVTYKLAKEIPNNKNSIELRNFESIEMRLRHIKDRFKEFLNVNLLKFDEYQKFLDKKKANKIENDANFDLYYFENFSECIKKFKEFIKDLNYLKLLNDDASDLSTTDSSFSIDNKTTLKLSEFKERLHNNFFKKLENKYGNVKNKNWHPFLDGCCDYLKDEILNYNIFFPIGEKYDINFYIEQLSNLIYKSVEEIRSDFLTATPENKKFFLEEIINSFKFNLKNLQMGAVKDLCETKAVFKHFPELLEREIKTIEDYIEVEKIVCDYYNTFAYIFNLYHGFSTMTFNSYPYVSPILINNYDMRIVFGIEMEFNLPTNCVNIRGFDDKGEEINMIKDTDYFIVDFFNLYCPAEVLKTKNIQEIEAISLDNENNIKFKVNEYLSH